MDDNVENLVKLYNFKPMYTKQENPKVLKTQLESWCNIVKKHYKITRTFKFEQAASELLFSNAQLGRRLEPSFREDIVNKLYKDGNLMHLLSLKGKQATDKSFSKKWNSKSDFTNKSELLLANPGKLRKGAEEEDYFSTFVLFESVEFLTDLLLEYMDLNSGNENIFTIYELSKCDGIFAGKQPSPFLSNDDSAVEDGDDEFVPRDLIVYIIYKGLVDKNLVYPIFEDNDFVAIKKL